MHNQNQTKQRRAGLVRSHGIKVRKLRAAAFGEASAAALAGLVLMLVAFPVACSVDPASAADSGSASTTVTYDFAPTIDISLSKANVDFNISANEFNKLKTDSLNVTVSTNNVTGYTLNMTTDSSATNGATITTDDGSGGTTTQENVATNALVNTSNNKFYIPSITSSITNPTDSTFPVNSWGYSINAVDASGAPSTSDIVYNPLPNAGSSTEIKKVTELDFPTDGSTANVDDVTPVTIATKADMSIPAGTYTNKLVFTAVTNYNAEYDNYTITYDRNGTAGDGTNGTIGGDMSMVSHTDVKEGDSIMLYAPNYWRTGYGFVGWSFTPNATKYVPYTDTATNTINTNLSTGEAYVYGPNESITAPYLSNEENQHKTLYAIWKASEGNLQNWSGCNAMSIGDVTALTDIRDNNTYTVAKLADGKCWLSENLRLSSGTIDSATTNNPISNFTWTESNNSWCTSSSSACYNQVLINTNNINSGLTASPSTNNNSSSWYGYGVNYNWYVATAGNGTYEKTSGNVTGDICPLGWHLPTSTDSGEFQAMYIATGSTPANIRKYPNNFVLSGYWYGSSADTRGSIGRYWPSTARDNNSAYDLYLSSSSVNPSDRNSKRYGFSARCISNTATIDGVDYIRLADGNWWTKNSQGQSDWSGAATLCPSGTSLPTAEQFDNLLTAYGGAKYSDYKEPYGWRYNGADLYNATGWSSGYWPSTEYASNTARAWVLFVYPSVSYVDGDYGKTRPYNVVCVKS